MFEGFSQGTMDFLWGIKFNNQRDWFQEHRSDYLELADRPLRQLGEGVAAALGEECPKLGLQLHVSRIYRDARRLHGRGPYKEHLWFTLRRPSEGWSALPAFYFEIAPEYFSYGMGTYDATPVTMAKLRARIDRDPKPVEKLARGLKGSPFVLEGQEYKRPKGDPGELLRGWYNRKNLSFNHDDNCEGVFFTPELANQVAEGFRFLMPYYQFLTELAGDPTPERE